MEYSKKSSWSKYLSSVHKSEETILNASFTSVLLSDFCLNVQKKEENIPFSNLFRRIFSASLRCTYYSISEKISFSIIAK